MIRTARITTPTWSAQFQSDGTVISADPKLAFMIGWPDGKVRAVVKKNGWKATVIASSEAADAQRGREGEVVTHDCSVCGARAPFGYGVSLIKDKIGIWYCRHHRPEQHMAVAA